MDFITENLNVLILVILFVGVGVGAGFYYKKITKTELYKIGYILVLKAENLFKEEKQGVTKKEYVINKLYEYLPKPLRFLISVKDINDIVENSVQKMKDVLATKRLKIKD